jgi:alpha-L-fucosidase 2
MDNMGLEKVKRELWYDKPAKAWEEALPIGNGRLGAMVFGGLPHERIQLNEDTLWSGAAKDWDNPGARQHLEKVRAAILSGNYTEGDRLCRQMQGPYTQSYLPLGDLLLDFNLRGAIAGYRRSLDLDQALAITEYSLDGCAYTRIVFASQPDQVIVVHLETSQPGKLNFSARLDSPLQHSIQWNAKDILLVEGRCPVHVDPSYVGDTPDAVQYASASAKESIRFLILLQARTEGGTLQTDEHTLRIQNANTATLILSACTSFNGYDKQPLSQGADALAKALDYLSTANFRSFPDLLSRHIRDHQSLFKRVALDLGDGEPSSLPTDARLRIYKAAPDPSLEALLFQYGRYLLIASSRPGTQPANLQGIWNQEVRPPWSSNYTININTQMNYWPAESCNLAECHQPLIQFITELAQNGAKTAAENYGARGWVAHHNSDLWRQSAPVGNYGHGDPVWANWTMGGAWLCQHLWEHFAFGGELDYLRKTAYTVMRSAAEFCLDWLIEDDQGRLVTAPSVSPELHFYTPEGEIASATLAATMDMAILHDLFTNCIQAAQWLEIDEDFRARLETARSRMMPYQIGSRGQLQEWALDHPETEVRHRHASHLFGLHPGRQIKPMDSRGIDSGDPPHTGIARRREHRLVDGLEGQPVGAAAGRRPRPPADRRPVQLCRQHRNALWAARWAVRQPVRRPPTVPDRRQFRLYRRGGGNAAAKPCRIPAPAASSAQRLAARRGARPEGSRRL